MRGYPVSQSLPQADPKQRERELEQLLIAYQHLVDSDGWKLMDAWLHSVELAAYTHMTEGPSAEAMKHVGAYHAIRNVRTIPHRQIEGLIGQLRKQ